MIHLRCDATPENDTIEESILRLTDDRPDPIAAELALNDSRGRGGLDPEREDSGDLDHEQESAEKGFESSVQGKGRAFVAQEARKFGISVNQGLAILDGDEDDLPWEKDPANPNNLLQAKDNMTLEGFRGRYAFLSNFHPAAVTHQGLTFQNAEAAYQAAKFNDQAFRARFTNLGPAAARSLGRAHHPSFRTDWSDARLGIMEEVLRSKFTDPELRRRLVATGSTQLVEFNSWRDQFFGVYNGRGQNHLGRLLMELRDEFTKAPKAAAFPE